MGGNQGRIRGTTDGGLAALGGSNSPDERTFYDLSIIPSKAVFTPTTEDISGQVILDLRQPFARPGIIVISLDGKETFEYVPFGGKSSASAASQSQHHNNNTNAHRNENKFLREREVLAQFASIGIGRHVFNFNFQLTGQSRLPPTVNRVAVSIYETTNRVDKVVKVDYPILIKDSYPQKNLRKNFIEMGQSEVVSCLSGLGSGGICSFQVKCNKDCFKTDEQIAFLGKLDNTRSRQAVNKVEVKLLRFIRLHTQQAQNSSSQTYDLVLTQELSRAKFGGIPGRNRDTVFHREYNIGLDYVFAKQRNENLQSSNSNVGKQSEGAEEEDPLNEEDLEEFVQHAVGGGFSQFLNQVEKLPSVIAPSAYGKTFMIHYAVQVSLKHPGIFSQPTQLEVDINIDSSRNDYKLYEQLLALNRDRANKIRVLGHHSAPAGGIGP